MTLNQPVVNINVQRDSTVCLQPALMIGSGRASYCLNETVACRYGDHLVPRDFDLRLAEQSRMGTDLWFEGARGGLLVRSYGSSTTVLIVAVGRTVAEAVLAEIRASCPPADPCEVPLEIYRMGSSGIAVSDCRQVVGQPWLEVRPNYPQVCRGALDALMGMQAPTTTARLILWHGEAGTGKTSAALALMLAWAGWCSASLITDPERMFQDANYLVSLLSARERNREGLHAGDTSPAAEPARRWRLLLCEDADEYLRSDARARSGPALGRLLNATDGLLGRGTRTLVLLTTNDEVGRLHPAVTRPGRCLATVEFPLFSVAEAARWLGLGAVPRTPMSLAEMYYARSPAEEQLRPATPEHRMGIYL